MANRSVARSGRSTTPDEELYRAACEAMRLLQDRQAHTPQELLDPREVRVLRRLRLAIRRAS